jgi:hypothetical protein
VNIYFWIWTTFIIALCIFLYYAWDAIAAFVDRRTWREWAAISGIILFVSCIASYAFFLTPEKRISAEKMMATMPPLSEKSGLSLTKYWSDSEGRIIGQVINTTSRTYQSASIAISFLDANHRVVDTQRISTSGIAPRAVWFFTMDVPKTYARYKVSDITGNWAE